ncbi:bifunctional DNA-formamidopyrimidine glycosylase/DNA-(apurinic or apyrimidinic site) lyase [soil metagenome]
MPELPEVETYVRELEPILYGCTVTGVRVRWARTIAEPDATTFAERMIGQRFTSFNRRGKYMLLGLESGDTLIVHLRMTGHLFIQTAGVEPDKHTHVIFDLDDARQLHYQDSRKFGRMWLVADPEQVLHKLGPEPLSEQFVVQSFADKLLKRNISIKTLLLDQTIVAGVGNIYADEALFAAGLHPARTGGNLTLPEMERLHAAIRTILQKAILLNGSSLGTSKVQNYLRPSGEPGGFQDQHNVYQRTGKICLQCGQLIERIVLAQRSTHFCAECQK